MDVETLYEAARNAGLLTVVTVAIPYLMSACAQLAYLVSRRRKVHGWLLARDLLVTAAAVLFSMWVTFAAGYAAVYEALVVVLVGVVIYAFLKAHREAAGLVPAPADADAAAPALSEATAQGTAAGRVPIPRPREQQHHLRLTQVHVSWPHRVPRSGGEHDSGDNTGEGKQS